MAVVVKEVGLIAPTELRREPVVVIMTFPWMATLIWICLVGEAVYVAAFNVSTNVTWLVLAQLAVISVGGET